MAKTLQEAFIKDVENNNLKRTAYIIKLLKTANISDEDGYNILTYVKTDEMYELLTQNGAHFDNTKPTIHNLSLFNQSLLKARHYKVAQQLISLGADVNYIDRAGRTPLMLADNIELATTLIDNGANINQRDRFNNSTMINIAKKNSNLMELLIKRGYDINSTDKHGATDLIKLVTTEHLELVEQYLALKADPNIGLNEENDTPLHFASNLESSYTSLLIKYGANVNLKNAQGDTPLSLASYACNIDTMQILLENNADVNTANNNGKTPLMELYTSLSDDNKYEKATKLLLKYKPNILAKDKYGLTIFEQPTFTGRKQLFFKILTSTQNVNNNIIQIYQTSKPKSIIDY